MDDLDIDELLECEDIEQSAFISSSKHLLKVFDNIISGIDDRINSKRGAYYGNGGGSYYHHHNQDVYGNGSYDMYGGSAAAGAGGYHKQ